MSMTLDRSKKYEGFGLTFRRTHFDSWIGEDQSQEKKPLATVYDPVMQAWLDAGHIKPVRTTKIVRVEGCVIVNRLDWYQVISCNGTREEIPSGATAKPVTLEFEFEVEA